MQSSFLVFIRADHETVEFHESLHRSISRNLLFLVWLERRTFLIIFELLLFFSFSFYHQNVELGQLEMASFANYLRTNTGNTVVNDTRINIVETSYTEDKRNFVDDFARNWLISITWHIKNLQLSSQKCHFPVDILPAKRPGHRPLK